MQIEENMMTDINTIDINEMPSHSNEERSISIAEDKLPAVELESSPQENEKEDLSYIAPLVQELGNISEPDDKLKRIISFMEESLAQTGSPHFKSFWQARVLCLSIFKENISPAVRSNLWTKYTELSKEARRLKDLLDEQSAFAVEQIEIAIQAIESEIVQFNQDEKPLTDQGIEICCQALKKNHQFYKSIQNELDFLNKQASRINALRKELIKTDMRVRKKNKFFNRLSLLGDKVFPRRKELIAELSNQFMADVDSFISYYFVPEKLDESLFFLREEIKSLQGTAKLFTLNTHAFTQSRMRLSECWDKIKNEEKERKKQRAEQKTAYKANVDAVLQKLDEIKKTIQENQTSPAEGVKKLEEVSGFMRTVELGRDEVHYLREQITEAKAALLDQLKSEEQKRQDQEQERQRQKQQKILEFKREIDQLMRSLDVHDFSFLTQQRDEMMDKVQSAGLIKSEKMELERLLKPLKDIIADKKAMSLATLSADDRQALQQLKDALQERKALRQEIKDQVEALRKALGSSSLDFVKAMEYNSQMHAQKERLEKMNQAVNEIEKKIQELQAK